MRLYLSSQNIGNHPDRLLKLVGENRSVAYLRNAKDNSHEEIRVKIPKHKQQFEELGFKFQEFDLRKYIGKKNELEKEIKKFGLVFGTGGNTFLLRRAMYDSGLDNILIRFLREDKLVYGGSSAGSVVATPSLRGCESWDSLDELKSIYGSEPIWEGLNLVPFYFVPHHNSDWAQKEADDLIEYYENNDLEYKALEDGQVLVTDGKKAEILR